MIQSIVRILLLLQCFALLARADVSQQALQKWVDDSALIFTGTIVEMGASNVSGINSKDFPMIVRVEKVVSGDEQALEKFGSLNGSEFTVAVNPALRSWLRNNVSAVFFADPLAYETNIGVVAKSVVVADQKGTEDFFKRLQAAAVRKSEAPLRSEVAGADLIVTGEVEAVGPLASNKAADLASVENDWELRSEHSPRWREAIVKVQLVEKIEKGRKKPPFVAVIFPGARDCFGAASPKFEVKQPGIWLLHQNQLDEQEARVLLKSEKYNGNEIQSYTALAPADFQDLTKLDRIRQMIAETKP